MHLPILECSLRASRVVSLYANARDLFILPAAINNDQLQWISCLIPFIAILKWFQIQPFAIHLVYSYSTVNTALKIFFLLTVAFLIPSNFISSICLFLATSTQCNNLSKESSPRWFVVSLLLVGKNCWFFLQCEHLDFIGCKRWRHSFLEATFE